MDYNFEGAIYKSKSNQGILARMASGGHINSTIYVEAECVAFKKDCCYFKFGENVGKMQAGEMALFEQKRAGRYLVNKVIGFNVVDEIEVDDTHVEYVLSRKEAQRHYYDTVVRTWKARDVIDGKISSMEEDKVYIDMGRGILGMLKYSDAAVCFIPNMHDFFNIGEHVKTILMSAVSPDLDKYEFPKISHKELLGTWDDNTSDLAVGDVVQARVIRKADYGVFVMIKPNLMALSTGRIPIEDFDHYKINDIVVVQIDAIKASVSKVQVIVIKAAEVKKATDVPEKNYVFDYDWAANDNKWVYNYKNTNDRRQVVRKFED